MAGIASMSGMFLFLIFSFSASSVFGRFCINPECSEPISSARIKKAYNTRDVHLFVGDEVDLISKSDDGSFFEFELGDVKGIIPTDHIREDSLSEIPERLEHIPEVDDVEEDVEGDEDIYPNDSGEGEMFYGDMEDHNEQPKRKKSKKKAAKKIKKSKESAQENKDGTENVLSENHKKMKEQVNEKEQNKENSHSNNQLHKIEEPVISEASLFSSDMSGDFSNYYKELSKMPNFIIMKKRYMNDYLARNYAGKEVTDEIKKEVEEFVENDMLEQIKEPDSELLHMLVHYDPKDLPGGEPEKQDEANADGEKASVDDIKKTEESDEKSEKQTSDDSKDGTTGNLKTTNNSEDPAPRVTIDSFVDDFTKHPNFQRLKSKHLTSYLNTHYSGEENIPEIREMVSKLIQDDLVRQLSNADSPLREELLKQGSETVVKEKEANVKVSDEGKVEPKQDPQTPLEQNLEQKKDDAVKVNKNIKVIVDKVVHSSTNTNGTDNTNGTAVAVETSKVDESVPKEKTASEKVSDDHSEPIPPAGGKEPSKQDEKQPEDLENEVPPAGGKEPSKQNEKQPEGLENEVPPAGGKELSKQDEKQPEDLENEESPAGGKELSKQDEKQPEDLKNEEPPAAGKEPSKQDEKQQEDLENADKPKKEPSEDSDGIHQTTQENTADDSVNTEENTAKFSIKKLGNALKDRFKAFASKFASKETETQNDEEDDENKRDSVTSDAPEANDSIDVKDAVDSIDSTESKSYDQSDSSKASDSNNAKGATNSIASTDSHSDSESDSSKTSDFVASKDVIDSVVSTDSQPDDSNDLSKISDSVATKDVIDSTVSTDLQADDDSDLPKTNVSVASKDVIDSTVSTDSQSGDRSDSSDIINSKDDKATTGFLDDRETEKAAQERESEKKWMGNIQEVSIEELLREMDPESKETTSDQKVENEHVETRVEEKVEDKAPLPPINSVIDEQKDQAESKVDNNNDAEDLALQSDLASMVAGAQMNSPSSEAQKKDGNIVEEKTVKNSDSKEMERRHVPREEQSDASEVAKEQEASFEASATVSAKDGNVESKVDEKREEERSIFEGSSETSPIVSEDSNGNVKEAVPAVVENSVVSEQVSKQTEHEENLNAETNSHEKENQADIGSVAEDQDSSVNVVSDSKTHSSGTEKRSVAEEPDQQHERDVTGKDQDGNPDFSHMSEEDARDALLETCHHNPNIPDCDRLRGTKIYRKKDNSDDSETSSKNSSRDEENIGKLERAWRNLVKIMKRIKLMKLGVVRLFHGPLSVMGLEDISHWIHEVVEQASPEVITITVCCVLLIITLLLKSALVPKHVTVGPSAYDVHKMRQSKQRILQEDTEDMEKEIRRLREIVESKESKIGSGDKTVKKLEKSLQSLQDMYEQKEILLADIRKEVEEGKTQQKKLQELIDEKEVEIKEADSMVSRHENEIVRQKDISDALNDRLQKVVEELDVKDGVVMELQEKNGALHVELENLEMERRQVEKERKEIQERCKELEEELKAKEEENGKLQDEIEEKENEVEVLRDCMAQINNGKLDGEAMEDFDTPEEDPDIKEQLKTERLKQIVESTQALANLKKSEKEKEYFQEGYLEEREKRENAEEQVKTLQTDIERLSKDVNTYKTSSTEYQIKMETLQQYFKQQVTDLHRKLSDEEQSRIEFQRKYESVVSQSSSAVEETANVKLQNEDLKNEIKEMERGIKDTKMASEKETHELWIKNRQMNRDLEEMKRERDIYRKRLLEAETARKRSSPIPAAGMEKSRDSPAGSDDGRPQSPGSQKSSASGLPNFMSGPRPMFGMVPPPPPPLFPRGPMPMPMGPMPPRPGPFGPPGGVPSMMGNHQTPVSQPLNTAGGPPMSTAGPPSIPSGPFNPMGHPMAFGGPRPMGYQGNPGMPPNSMNPSSTAGNPIFSQSQDMMSQAQGRVPGQTTPNMQRRFPPQQQTMQGPMHSTPVNSPSQSQISQLPPSHPSLAANQMNQHGRPQLHRRTTGSNVS
ncbi:kinectin-like isoform X2 [Rhopilema esculentum]|uniref:kinectin-like isoform X2 n=1 Tax=Rhopilema esculentum TaxID=499914 RepID=UPI0031D2664C